MLKVTIFDRNSMKNLRGIISPKTPNQTVKPSRGHTLLSPGYPTVPLSGLGHSSVSSFFRSKFGKNGLLMRDLRIKVRIYELKLNRLIKSHLSQNRSKSRSRNRWLSLHSPRRPGSLLAHCRRWWALSNGASLPQRKNRGQEIKINHWPKKPYFRRFPASLPRKLWPGFTIWSSVKHIQGSGPLESCCSLEETSPFWRDPESATSPGRLPGIASEGQVLSLSSFNQTCVKSLINNLVKLLINYSSSTLTLASRESCNIQK